MEFLNTLFRNNASYSALVSAKAAVATLTPEPSKLSSHHLVRRFLRGAFNLKPALPKKCTVWDPRVVLDHIKGMGKLKNLTLEQMTKKLAMLLALNSAQRVQTLSLLETTDIERTGEQMLIYVSHLLKQTRPGAHLRPIMLKPYTVCKKLCVVRTLRKYLRRTRKLRSSSRLFVSYHKPHGAVTSSTIARWLKTTIADAGIRGASAHSTRSAAVSKAFESNVPIDTIMNAAGWSKSDTFAKFYNKKTKDNFGSELLAACRK